MKHKVEGRVSLSIDKGDKYMIEMEPFTNTLTKV